MINYEALLERPADRPVRAAVAGVGEFGLSLVVRARSLPALSIAALVDRDPARVASLLQASGFDPDTIARCDSRKAALGAVESGRVALLDDAELLDALPLDIVVEATGDPSGGTRIARAAIERGQHVALVSKEVESVAGPMLHRLARRRGVVCTPVDGDQPSLLIKLVSWARTLGLPIVAAGKASEHDFVLGADGRTVHCRDLTVALDEPLPWEFAVGDCREALSRRSGLLSALPQKTAPDFCEMAVVANATGILPDCATMHAPIARAVELPDVYRAQREGGVLAGEGSLDVFNCLRRHDEASFAGGVFVIVDLADTAVFALLRGKGIPSSRSGGRILLYNPSHLLGVEAPVSILAACRLGLSTLTDDYRPRIDMIARATARLAAGTVLAVAGRHELPQVAPEFAPAAPLAPRTPLPYYLAAGRRMREDVAPGTAITLAAIEIAHDDPLLALRREMDATFLAEAPPGAGARPEGR